MKGITGEPSWHLVARVRGADAAATVFALLDETAGAASAFEGAAGEWRIEAYPRSPLLTPGLGARLALAAAAAGGTLIESGEERLVWRDWLAENQLAFPPLRIGRFFVYGSHYRGLLPAGAIGLAIDAASAFGTGEHPSTRACLIALERLALQHRPRRPLDTGTGTGILAIAAAKLLRGKVLATDIDPGAVRVARYNAARNGVAGLVRVRQAAGYRYRAIRRIPYDLVLANILARPLALMAADLARNLAPDGRVVLSGLLRRQEPAVLAPYRGCGLVLERRLAIEEWSTLILRRRRGSGMAAGSRPLPPAGRRLRPPWAARTVYGRGAGAKTTRAAASEHPAGGRRSENGGSRYRRARDRREPSIQRKPVPDAATRRKLSRQK